MMELFELPKAVEIDRTTTKRLPKPPDQTLLKGEQVEAFNRIMDFIMAPGGGMVLLEGVAGTGKTFTVSMIIEHLLATTKKQIACSATTNKAVKTSQKMAAYSHSRLEYATIHSLLGLREQIAPDGSIRFVPDTYRPGKIEEYQIVFIDESSMLDDSIFNYLLPYTSRKKIIFIGDPQQIPPIGKTNSIPFIPEERQRYGITVVPLTTIQRQAFDNPIIALSKKVRECRPGRDPMDGVATAQVDDRGVFVLDRNDKKFFRDLLQHLFCSPNFDADSDFAKALAWTNATVGKLNESIRRLRFGMSADEERIHVGERIIADKPIIERKTVLISTNEEMEVMSYTKELARISDEDDTPNSFLQYYDTEVRYYNVMGHEVRRRINILTNEAMPRYKEILEHLKNIAKSQTPRSQAAGIAWANYYDFERQFAHIAYNYAITVHKSQGSTYDNAIVFTNNILSNRKEREANRILYTAVTRPAKRLYLV